MLIKLDEVMHQRLQLFWERGKQESHAQRKHWRLHTLKEQENPAKRKLAIDKAAVRIWQV